MDHLNSTKPTHQHHMAHDIAKEGVLLFGNAPIPMDAVGSKLEWKLTNDRNRKLDAHITRTPPVMCKKCGNETFLRIEYCNVCGRNAWSR